MSDAHTDVILRILELMKLQSHFLSDALTRIDAIRLFLADRDSLDYTEYKQLLEKAIQQGDCSLPNTLAAEIDEMIQTISGKGSVQ